MSLIKDYLKKSILSGIVITLPLAFTYWIFAYLIIRLDELARILLETIFPDHYQKLFIFKFHGYGIIFAVITVLIIGIIGRNFIGQYFLVISEKLLAKLPFIPTVYSSIKQIITTFASEKDSYSGVALVEYPKKDLYTIAFMTGNASKQISESLEKSDLVNLYVPTTPNPTSGFYLITERKNIIPINLTVEEAFKMLLSCGISKN